MAEVYELAWSSSTADLIEVLRRLRILFLEGWDLCPLGTRIDSLLVHAPPPVRNICDSNGYCWPWYSFRIATSHDYPHHLQSALDFSNLPPTESSNFLIGTAKCPSGLQSPPPMESLQGVSFHRLSSSDEGPL